MRPEKKLLTVEYVKRLNASPFFFVVDYKGLSVAQMSELRKRLKAIGAQIFIVKNSIFRVAAKEAGIGDLNGALTGQCAVVTGQKDISAAAKVVKTLGKELDRLRMHFGYLNNQRLGAEELLQIADLPGLEVLRARLLAAINAPATKLAVLLNTPATQLARVIKARSEQANPAPAS
ncbi:MAG: 50S ribosomal protein L10 [Verrucomicrobiae bacterium]|nr:50S ribosomal protein L10 [Verrucomicrobiae bacterium]MDW8310138.1 50S ribosomal protein L10 [Verrucomicrobiales bacterium]